VAAAAAGPVAAVGASGGATRSRAGGLTTTPGGWVGALSSLPSRPGVGGGGARVKADGALAGVCGRLEARRIIGVSAGANPNLDLDFTSDPPRRNYPGMGGPLPGGNDDYYATPGAPSQDRY